MLLKFSFLLLIFQFLLHIYRGSIHLEVHVHLHPVFQGRMYSFKSYIVLMYCHLSSLTLQFSYGYCLHGISFTILLLVAYLCI